MALLRLFITTLLGISLLTPVGAGEMYYGADIHQAVWKVSSSRMQCSLTQEIPYYGKAVFEKGSGGKLDFYIAVRQQPSAPGMAKLVSAAPAWKHDTLVRDLGSVDYTPSNRTFRVGEAIARRLLLELEQGMYPTFSYKDWADGRDQVQVALSAVNLRNSLGDFLTCLDNQIGFTLDDVRSSRIHFGFNSSNLGGEARQRLDKVAEYLLADPEVTQVTLKGLTDSVGYRRYNQALAKRRALAVQNYLVSKGVAKSRFTISATGEASPVASNRTASGRATNRVVVVTLMK